MTAVADNALTLEKISSGKKLYKFAWALEIIAAFIGLMIAWSQGFLTYDFYIQETGSFPVRHLYDLMLAALPFVMVASVELLKIPFCKIIYLNKVFKIRFLFSMVLVLITFITFETFSQGFESQFNNITMKVSTPQKELKTVNQNMRNFEEQILVLQQKTEESISDVVSIRSIEAETIRDSAKKALEDQKTQYRTTGNQKDLDTKENLETRITRAKERRDEKIKQTESNFITVSEEEQARQAKTRAGNNRQIEIFEENIKRLEDNITALEIDESIFDILGGKKGQWEKEIKKYRGLIEALLLKNTEVGLGSANSLTLVINRINKEAELQIDELYAQIDKIDLKLAQDSKYTNEIALIDLKIIKIQEKYNDEIDAIAQYRQEQTKDLANKNKKIDELESQLVPLKDEVTALEIVITDAYELTPIYRYARSFYGLEPGVMITEKQISFVAAIWYGSLALIVSTMGIFLAFGSFIFMYSGMDFEELKKRGSGPIGRAYRKALLAKRKKYRKRKTVIEIKEVIKEVPVNKVEIKEVPIEVIRKEVIHVPIYTNDPDLIKFGTTKVKKILDDD